jgi:serine/threonine protein kinase/tetratricopeptide (TPR) repeat protein
VCLLLQAVQSEAAVVKGGSADEGRFDHYELIRREDGALYELGHGAMGVTYKAFDTVLHHPVALKVIDARVAADPNVRKRFLREARAAARFRHQNLASVFYYGTRKSDGQCFYAMELIEGETLEAHLRRSGPLSPALALEVIAQVTKALVAAEVQGLVHRDLKPANLMLVEGPEFMVKVIDFGLARAAATAGSDADLTHGGFVGTPAFASPEQFAGVGVDIRSDLYSLGVVLWKMVAGHVVFRGSPAELMYQHQHTPLPLDMLEATPQPVVVLLKVLLEKDPGRRFQTPAELLKALPLVTDAIDAGHAITRESLQETPSANTGAGTRRSPTRRIPEKISVAGLPVTGSDVFGREQDIAFLDHAWANQHVHVVTIVAWAGIGKSTLVNHWLGRIAAENYRSAELVFGWSFYRQGTSGGSSSADEFLDAALTWFGDPDPRIGSEWAKGERLARLVVSRRTLLVLDGLEPLQNPPGPQEGRLREPSLQALLRELAAFNTGLCVITTRLPVADIADRERTSAPRRELEQLSTDAGAKLLRALGVKGNEEQLRSASDEFGGHCLALTLLGSYLTDAYGGDIRSRKEVSARLGHDSRLGVHARKVMESYQAWLGEGPELSVLRMLGLFDRPADEKALRAVLKPPAIPELTEFLAGLSVTEWRMTLTRLRRARLLAGEDPHNPGQVDTHPLVREFFGEQLRGQQSDAWKEGNRRLYYHYCSAAPQLPNSIREMEPLFLAVICGCQGGLFRGALHAVFLPRIQRGTSSFAAKVLGATGALLSVLAHFFDHGRWGSLVQGSIEEQNLTPEDQLFILMQSGLHLTATRGMGTPEAQICYERAEVLGYSLRDPFLLFSALIGQWEYSVMTEKLTATMIIAKRIVCLSQEQKEPELMIGACTSLAVTLYFMGDFEAAQQHAIRGIQIWRSVTEKSLVEGIDPVAPNVESIAVSAVACLVFDALSEWHLGEITSCEASMREAISLAKESNDTHSLALSLCHAAILAHFEGNPDEVERWAAEAIELSTRQNFAQWLYAGTVYHNWARTASGQTIEGISRIGDAIQDARATGWIRTMPYSLALKAEALHLADRTSEALETVNEAVALAKISEELWWCAELYRLRGVFLATLGADESQIEASFCEAINAARAQKSISLAKRAEATYAEYRRQKASGLGGHGFRLPLC